MLLIYTVSAAALLSSLLLRLRLHLSEVDNCHGHQQDANQCGEGQTTNLTNLHKGIQSFP